MVRDFPNMSRKTWAKGFSMNFEGNPTIRRFISRRLFRISIMIVTEDMVRCADIKDRPFQRTAVAQLTCRQADPN